MPRLPHVEGYAIVSEDGMIANGQGKMPDALKVEADQRFFERELDKVDVVIHGRHSNEGQTRSHARRRLILTRHIHAIEPDPSNDKALLWNPVGASLEQALTRIGAPHGRVGVIGGTHVFEMFLDRYDIFNLSLASNVYLPGGRPIFSDVPARTPEAILASHGLDRCQHRLVDHHAGLEIVSWMRSE